jgi:hypothetical protein
LPARFVGEAELSPGARAADESRSRDGRFLFFPVAGGGLQARRGERERPPFVLVVTSPDGRLLPLPGHRRRRSGAPALEIHGKIPVLLSPTALDAVSLGLTPAAREQAVPHTRAALRLHGLSLVDASATPPPFLPPAGSNNPRRCATGSGKLMEAELFSLPLSSLSFAQNR